MCVCVCVCVCVSLNPYTLLHTPSLPINLYFMGVNNRLQYSTSILSTTYTQMFTAIAYKSYNVNTKQITIKNKHHNPPNYYPYLQNPPPISLILYQQFAFLL